MSLQMGMVLNYGPFCGNVLCQVRATEVWPGVEAPTLEQPRISPHMQQALRSPGSATSRTCAATPGRLASMRRSLPRSIGSKTRPHFVIP